MAVSSGLKDYHFGAVPQAEGAGSGNCARGVFLLWC